MSTAAPQTRYTPEDLLAMPDGEGYELIDGQLVERHMSRGSSYVAGELHRRLSNHCLENHLGWAYPEGVGYQCFASSPELVRKADVSFIGASRLSAEEAYGEGHHMIPPDLAVEVVSPNDLVYEVSEKVQLYLDAGVRLVWVVNPQRRIVEVHRPDGLGTILRENDDLTGEDVVPGFRCRVGDLFAPPPGAASTAQGLP